jgi:hypothetical protein
MGTFNSLISRVVEQSELYARERPIKGLILFLFILVFGLPVLETSQQFVKEFPYITAFNTSLAFYNTYFTASDTFLLILVVILGLLILLIQNKLNRSRQIIDDFKANLSKWSIPMGDSWYTTISTGSTGKMLVVSTSNFPGLLKGAFGWYDYLLTFKGRIPEDSLERRMGVFIRAKDSSNGILLQMTENEFIPRYLYDGHYIIDNTQRTALTTKLPVGSWVNYSVKVTGNKVLLRFEGQEVHFTIKDYNFSFISRSALFGNADILKLETENNSNNRLFNQYLDKMEKFHNLQNNPESSEQEIFNAQKDQEEAWEKFNKKTQNSIQINLEYNNGSVGFGKVKNASINVREVKLTKLD